MASRQSAPAVVMRSRPHGRWPLTRTCRPVTSSGGRWKSPPTCAFTRIGTLRWKKSNELQMNTDEVDSSPSICVHLWFIPFEVLSVAALTPRQIVSELDRYIVGQDAAKKAVAVAIRNRWRRQQLPPDLRQDVTP